MDKLPLPKKNNSLLEMIGNTPLLEIKNIDVGVVGCSLKWNLIIQVGLLKIELQFLL